MPIGAPGWPELACWTASIASARIALAIRGVFCVCIVEVMSMQKPAKKRRNGAMERVGGGCRETANCKGPLIIDPHPGIAETYKTA